MKKGQSTKSLGKTSSRKSLRSPSPKESKKVDVKLMSPPARKASPTGGKANKHGASSEQRQAVC
jgi:hypothetical protein